MRRTRNRGPLLCLVLGLSILASTLASTAVQAQVTAEDLLGTWRWVESSGGFTGDTITPADPEWPPLQLHFEPEGKLRISVEGVLVEGTYELSKDGITPQTLSVVFDAAPEDLPLLAVTESYAISIPVPGLLMLDEGCCDRYLHTFALDPSAFLPVDATSLGALKSLWDDSPR